MREAWPQAPLGEVLVQNQEYVDSPEPRLYPKLSVRLYGKGVVLDTPADGTTLKMKRHQLAKVGQVILSEIWGKKGAIGFVPPEGAGALCTSHFFLFDVRPERLDPRWLQPIFRANYLQEQLDAEAKGTTGYAAVRPKHLLQARIPLPPLPEQRRIVARIDQLSTKIEEARGVLSQSTREQDSFLVTSRNTCFNRLTQTTNPARLDSVADSRLGKMLSRNQAQDRGGTPYIRNANVQWDRLDLSVVYRMNVTDEDRATFALQRGDILVCEGGDIGKSAIWDEEIPGCIYQKALHRVRVNQKKLIPRFLLQHIFWAAEQGHLTDIKTQTTIAHLTGVKLKAYPVLVPALEEQRHIVQHLDGLQAKVDNLKKLKKETSKELDALMPSVLSKAFSGEL